MFTKVSQHLQQLTDAARPSVAEATDAAAATLQGTASAMTADLCAQAAERAAQQRTKLVCAWQAVSPLLQQSRCRAVLGQGLVAPG